MILTWDGTGDKIYESGVDHGVLYKKSASHAYGSATPWNGLTAVNESPSGAEATKLWADNIQYATMYSAEEYACTIEAYTYPEEFEECDGSKQLAPGVYMGQQNRKPFGFSYRSLIGNDEDGLDHGYELHLIYNLMAKPSERSRSTTNDSPEAVQFSWECDSTPVAVNSLTGVKPTCQITIKSTDVDKAALTALENALYGTASEEAYLPTPDEVIALIGATTA